MLSLLQVHHAYVVHYVHPVHVVRHVHVVHHIFYVHHAYQVYLVHHELSSSNFKYLKVLCKVHVYVKELTV